MAHADMSGFLLLNAGIAAQIRQGDLPEDYDDAHNVCRVIENKWNHLDFCICSWAICDIDRGTSYLPITIWGDYI